MPPHIASLANSSFSSSSPPLHWLEASFVPVAGQAGLEPLQALVMQRFGLSLPSQVPQFPGAPSPAKPLPKAVRVVLGGTKLQGATSPFPPLAISSAPPAESWATELLARAALGEILLLAEESTERGSQSQEDLESDLQVRHYVEASSPTALQLGLDLAFTNPFSFSFPLPELAVAIAYVVKGSSREGSVDIVQWAAEGEAFGVVPGRQWLHASPRLVAAEEDSYDICTSIDGYRGHPGLCGVNQVLSAVIATAGGQREGCSVSLRASVRNPYGDQLQLEMEANLQYIDSGGECFGPGGELVDCSLVCCPTPELPNLQEISSVVTGLDIVVPISGRVNNFFNFTMLVSEMQFELLFSDYRGTSLCPFGSCNSPRYDMFLTEFVYNQPVAVAPKEIKTLTVPNCNVELDGFISGRLLGEYLDGRLCVNIKQGDVALSVGGFGLDLSLAGMQYDTYWAERFDPSPGNTCAEQRAEPLSH